MQQIKGYGNGTGTGTGNSWSPAGGAQGKAAAGWTPQVVLVELKARILAALAKLSDRDTYQVGMEDLESIAHSLTADGIGIFLTCLHETDMLQRLVLRKECVKLVGTLASLHRELLSPHLPRIVTNLVRRLRDPDSAVRDACVDVVGVLAATVPYPAGGTGSTGGGDDIVSVAASSAAVGVYLKPLLDAMNDQSKGVQVGAALCLARVFDEIKHTPTGVVQRLVPRVLKLMASSGFQGKAALLSVVASLARAIGEASGPGGMPLLAALVPMFPECLESSDWSVRKAAADTLGRMAVVLGPHLTAPFKAALLPALEARRFDKVKPVRDCVNEALKLWNNIPDGELDQACAVTLMSGGPAVEDRAFGSATSPTAGKSHLDATASRKPAFGLHVEEEPAVAAGLTPLTAEGMLSGSRKRSPLLSDRKPNPDFFRKLKSCSDEVQIEVSAPHPRWGSMMQSEKGGDGASDYVKTALALPCYQYQGEPTNLGTEPNDKQYFGDVVVVGASRRVAENQAVVATSSNAADPIMWAGIRKHLQEIEHQQAQLIDMFRTFAVSSQDRMGKLETVIYGLERSLARVSRGAAAAASRSGGAAGAAAPPGAFQTKDTARSAEYATDDYNNEDASLRLAGNPDFCGDLRCSYDSDVSASNPDLAQVTQRFNDTSETEGDDDSRYWQVTKDLEATEVGSGTSCGFQRVQARSVWKSAEATATLAAIRDEAQPGGGVGLGMKNFLNLGYS